MTHLFDLHSKTFLRFVFIICVWMFECVYMFHMHTVPIGARRALAPLELELPTCVSCRVGVGTILSIFPSFPQLLKNFKEGKFYKMVQGFSGTPPLLKCP